MPAQVEADKCTGCGDCVENCPNSSISLNDHHAVVDREQCIDCNACRDTCTKAAIQMAD